jgi:signal transduction histidine kinase
MKHPRAEFSARYRSALRDCLRNKGAGNGDRPQGLGRAALSGGLLTRDVARIHEQAVIALVSVHDFTDPRNGSIRRAGLFLAQALTPLEASQRATRKSHRLLQQRNETLRLHAAALAAGNRQLKREIARREAGEATIRQVKARYQKLLLESQVMQRKLRLLTRQIISAQEEERKEISRELHDEVVQTLVGINVQLSALSRGTSLGVQTMKSKLALTRRLVENSVNAVHRFARELRPAALDDLGLIPALHAYCKNLATRKRIKIRLTAFAGVEDLGGAKRTVLFRVAQEALNNVARHSQATAVRVTITQVAGAAQMEIADNGKSFQVEKTLLTKGNKRLGLIGMRERVEMVGGTLAIESTPGRGTTVRARIPFNPPKTKS